MNVQITPEQEQILQQTVEAGLYSDPHKAMDRALQLLREDTEIERKKTKVRAMIEEGMEGPFAPGDMDSIIVEAKAKRAAASE